MLFPSVTRMVLGYFRNNRSRMNYFDVAEEGYPNGSGEVEAANKMLVTHRPPTAPQTLRSTLGPGWRSGGSCLSCATEI